MHFVLQISQIMIILKFQRFLELKTLVWFFASLNLLHFIFNSKYVIFVNFDDRKIEIY